MGVKPITGVSRRGFIPPGATSWMLPPARKGEGLGLTSRRDKAALGGRILRQDLAEQQQSPGQGHGTGGCGGRGVRRSGTTLIPEERVPPQGEGPDPLSGCILSPPAPMGLAVGAYHEMHWQGKAGESLPAPP